MLEYSVYRNPDFHLTDAAASIRRNHLYVQGWRLNEWLSEPQNIHSLIACRDAVHPVAVGVIMNDKYVGECYPNIGIFVKEGYRHQGIGKTILDHILKENVPYLRAATGVPISKKLYDPLANEGKIILLW